MYRIDRNTNRLEPLPQTSLRALGLYERQHLQEWLAATPSALGEDLLVIQKEFDGFGETNERLDLLALDKGGNLVVIENKLDDSGRDVVWQSLKYASYAASLTKAEIVGIYQAYLRNDPEARDAETELLEFLEADDFDELVLNARQTQRVFVVAGTFRKEVTSTAIWLLQYGLDLSCFTVTAYGTGDELFLQVGRIISTIPDQDYAIRMTEKAKEEVTGKTVMRQRGDLRQRFWAKLLEESNARFDRFGAISPGRAHWIQASYGLRSLSFVYLIGKRFARVELYIDGRAGSDAEVDRMYEFLLTRRVEIEESPSGANSPGCRCRPSEPVASSGKPASLVSTTRTDGPRSSLGWSTPWSDSSGLYGGRSLTCGESCLPELSDRP